MSATFHAPAKINLFLRVLAKRADGFHELESLVRPLPGLADSLHFQQADDFSLQCEKAGVPTDETNLVSRALRLFEQKTGLAANWKITLQKSIPHGAGLGGGSSDAATTFLALNQLHDTKIALADLSEWSATLGSDIPLFLHQSPCWCRGRGEIIEPIELYFPHPILLFKPAFDIPTPWAYQQWQNSQELPGISYAPQIVEEISLQNDLERPVFQKYLFLAELKTHLQNHPKIQAALMSGSGSTMFALLKNVEDAQEIIASTKSLDPTLWTHYEVGGAIHGAP